MQWGVLWEQCTRQQRGLCGMVLCRTVGCHCHKIRRHSPPAAAGCPAPPPPGAAAARGVVEPGYILSTVARKNILIVTITVVVTARMVLGLAGLCAGGMQPATGAGVRLVLSVVCLTTEATSHTAPPAAACLLLLLGMADHLGTQQGMWGVGCMQCCVSWRWCELVGCTQQ
jgi:hypothetical protein